MVIHYKHVLELIHHPVCAPKVASQLYLIAQPPLLGEEGNITHTASLDKRSGHRPRLQDGLQILGRNLAEFRSPFVARVEGDDLHADAGCAEPALIGCEFFRGI